MSARHAGGVWVFSRAGRAAGRGALGAGFLLAAVVARADPGVVTVRAQTVTTRYEAYARVEPIAVLPVRALAAGTVSDLEILPGASVRAGQKLAALDGPEIRAALAQAAAAVEGAQARLAAAEQSLAVHREQLPAHLPTRQALAEAESAAVSARADLTAARAQLEARRQRAALAAPVAGLVLAVDAAVGEPALPGQTLVTLVPAGGLWLRAVYYGSDRAAIRVGMTGRFAPAGGAGSIPVTVAAVFGSLQPDGGESVGLVAATASPGWLNGESGTVTLNGPVRSLVAVPTRALVLDRGQWWVLVHTAKGNQPQRVTPGPARGWQTFLESGIEPGADVVVENAYLEFHRGISKSYEPPD